MATLAKVLQLSPEQHDALGHATALAHAIHASISPENALMAMIAGWEIHV